MKILKIISYVLALLLLILVVILHYLVTKGKISIDVYTLGIAISIPFAILFLQFGRSIKAESTINELSKVPQIEKMIDEAKTKEEKIKVLEEEKEKLLEYIEIESKRMFLIKRLEDIDERLKDGYKPLIPLLNEIDILENELKQINDSYSSSISLKEIAKIRDRIEAKREGKLFLKIGKREFEINTKILGAFIDPDIIIAFSKQLNTISNILKRKK